MNRREEVRKLLGMSVEELIKESRGRLEVLPTLDDLHNHLAESIANEIEENNKKGRPTRLILPVGPTGQYPILKDLIRERKISLKNCYFFFMDEYCDDNGYALPKDHPLSFKGTMDKLFFKHIDPELNIPENQVIFPDHLNIQKLREKIAEVGGIDTCYGGIGIHGHVAFNEPEDNIKNSEPRLVYLNAYTITINAIRDEVGGNLINFPRKAVTLGMRQIMSARRIRLYCRNDVPTLDWANTVLRLAVLGEPGDDYPVTYLREHRDYKVITDQNTAKKPRYIL
ncbi:glucosamine-6-phosphate isomerase [Candidatus Aerophobetes bacterium]|nr:glucosamine-6-phosphate isomerase [Candidatus Aerophobetes bacterium]